MDFDRKISVIYTMYHSACGRVVLLLLFCGVQSLAAETVYTRQGNILHGRVVSSNKETLILLTEAGQISVPQADVERIDYADRESNVSIELNDGTILRGRISEQNQETILINTALGIITVDKTNIKIINYERASGAVESPISQPVPVHEIEKVNAGIRLNYSSLRSPGASGYGPSTGGAIFIHMRFSKLSGGMEHEYANFQTKEGSDRIQILNNRLVFGWNWYFRSNLITLSPTIGIGSASMHTRQAMPEYDLSAPRYFMDRGDTTGLLISALEQTPQMKLLSLSYFLSRNDLLGYLLSDRGNFSRDRTGLSSSYYAAISAKYNLPSGLSIGGVISFSRINYSGSELNYQTISLEALWRY